MGAGKAWDCLRCYGEGWVEAEEDTHELDLKGACDQYFPSVYVWATLPTPLLPFL